MPFKERKKDNGIGPEDYEREVLAAEIRRTYLPEHTVGDGDGAPRLPDRGGLRRARVTRAVPDTWAAQAQVLTAFWLDSMPAWVLGLFTAIIYFVAPLTVGLPNRRLVVKIVTWNVNGIRACIGKGLADYLLTANADIIGLQKTKVNAPIPDLVPPGYNAVWNAGERLGYSGTMCLYKQTPVSVRSGADDPRLDGEGRIITLEYPAFYYVNAYVPNSQGGIDRAHYRLDWDAAFVRYLYDLQAEKPVVVGGDFNVSRDYIDVFPENLRNIENPTGFTSEERGGFQALLDIGLVDVFRELHPSQERAYTWWSNRLNKRDENRGWRIDYFLISACLLKKVKGCEIRPDVFGSDHAPIELKIKL